MCRRSCCNFTFLSISFPVFLNLFQLMSRFMWYFFFICTLGRYNHYLINTTSTDVYKHEPLHLQIINTFFSIFTLLPSVLSSTGVNKLQPSPKVTFVPLKCMAKGLKGARSTHAIIFFSRRLAIRCSLPGVEILSVSVFLFSLLFLFAWTVYLGLVIGRLEIDIVILI